MSGATTQARLAILVAPVGNPKPEAVGVFIDDKLVGMMSLDHVRDTAAKIEQLEAARRDQAVGLDADEGDGGMIAWQLVSAVTWDRTDDEVLVQLQNGNVCTARVMCGEWVATFQGEPVCTPADGLARLKPRPRFFMRLDPFRPPVEERTAPKSLT